jgi:hypothetical protein
MDAGVLSPEEQQESTANSVELLCGQNCLCYSVDVTALFLNVFGHFTRDLRNLKPNRLEGFTFSAESS